MRLEGLGLTPGELSTVFPFHIAFDRECRVLQCGASIAKVLPKLEVGAELNDHLQFVRPATSWSFEDIIGDLDLFFLLRSKEQSKLVLRGQMLLAHDEDALVFLGSPWLTEIQQLKALGLTMMDFALHDSIADFLLLLQAKSSSLSDASKLADKLSEANRTLRSEMEERERIETQLRLAQKLESMGQLAAGIAHEINTPAQYVGDNTRFLDTSFTELTPILEKAEELAEAVCEGKAPGDLAVELRKALEDADIEFLAEQIPLAIEQALDGIGRVSKIVQSMKEFSHPGGEGVASVDLNRAIEATITVATNEWKYVADVETDFDPTLPPVPCLAGEVSQVVLNMIINAAHAIEDVVGDGTDGKGTISVKTCCRDDFVEIRIADTGTGIPEFARDRIFDPFFTTKEVGRGTGQGLAIAHGIVVQRHCGTLNYETGIGVGTTFIIRLPLEWQAVLAD